MSSEEDSSIELDADGEYVDDHVTDAEPEEPGTDDAVQEEPTECSTGAQTSANYIIVDPQDRITSHIMSIFEFTTVLETRAEQIARFGNCMVDLSGEPRAQAQAELNERKCPLCIERIVGIQVVDGVQYDIVEQWSPNEMDYPV